MESISPANKYKNTTLTFPVSSYELTSSPITTSEQCSSIVCMNLDTISLLSNSNELTSHNNEIVPVANPDHNNKQTVQDAISIHRKSYKIINEHLVEIQRKSIGHDLAAHRYHTYDRILGYPVVVLSAFITSSFMVLLFVDNDNGKITNYIGLILSAISFLMGLSREYLDFYRLFNEHDISSKLYNALLRSIELRIMPTNINNDDYKDIFKDMVDQMSIIERYERFIPSDIEKKISKQHIVPRSIRLNENKRYNAFTENVM